ncbi:putative RDD family membrane protein YckC [Lipingzhangella halophila]|uniref:Putative RDD family membrane protein YckC n=1 Tax=Lipingzhangella halophila TaxID=1783352 RepID=A0A7W7RJ96_9ACTN|nr:RDD family protein [Lipingzhangella halophila]MBB4932456.1 putative RDD family membrane protein YckC [Lipingzhangella halophila]
MAAAGGPPTADGRYPLASWSQRATARLIDWVVVAIPAGIVGMLIGFVWIGAQTMVAGYGTSTIGRNFWLIFAVCSFVVATAYETVCVKQWRRTVGKWIMSLEVAPLSAGGHRGPIPVASMMARAALLSVMFLFVWNEALQAVAFLFVAVFVALWPLWDGPRRQGMHDKLAGTVVVRTG